MYSIFWYVLKVAVGTGVGHMVGYPVDTQSMLLNCTAHKSMHLKCMFLPDCKLYLWYTLVRSADALACTTPGERDGVVEVSRGVLTTVKMALTARVSTIRPVT